MQLISPIISEFLFLVFSFNNIIRIIIITPNSTAAINIEIINFLVGFSFRLFFKGVSDKVADNLKEIRAKFRQKEEENAADDSEFDPAAENTCK